MRIGCKPGGFQIFHQGCHFIIRARQNHHLQQPALAVERKYAQRKAVLNIALIHFHRTGFTTKPPVAENDHSVFHLHRIGIQRPYLLHRGFAYFHALQNRRGGSGLAGSLAIMVAHIHTAGAQGCQQQRQKGFGINRHLSFLKQDCREAAEYKRKANRAIFHNQERLPESAVIFFR